MNSPIIVVGGGGHARVLIDALSHYATKIVGIVDPSLPTGSEVLRIPVLGGDDVVKDHSPAHVRLVNGIGSSGKSNKRKHLYELFSGIGYEFVQVWHPSAIVGGHVTIGKGTQIMAGAIVQTGATLGDNVLVNTRASVDHDCYVGDHVHIAPGATICGGVRIQQDVFVGSGATIIPGVEIEAGAIVGAGSVVMENVASGTTVVGVPARVIRK